MTRRIVRILDRAHAALGRLIAVLEACEAVAAEPARARTWAQRRGQA